VRCKLHKPKIDKSRKVALTTEELRKLVETSTGEHRTILMMFVLLGLRVGEFRGLQWRCIDFEKREVSVKHRLWGNKLGSPKSKRSERTIWMPQELIAEMMLHKNRSSHTMPDDYVFCEKSGKPYSDRWLRAKVLYLALDRIGIEQKPYIHGFHLFRHSVTTILDERTRSLRNASDLMGHAFESTTAGYSHRDRVAIKASQIVAEAVFAGRGLIVAETSSAVN